MSVWRVGCQSVELFSSFHSRGIVGMGSALRDVGPLPELITAETVKRIAKSKGHSTQRASFLMHFVCGIQVGDTVVTGKSSMGYRMGQITSGCRHSLTELPDLFYFRDVDWQEYWSRTEAFGLYGKGLDQRRTVYQIR
jgi:predicted Mrr-cat superfamily restriction endonuclease